MTFNPDESIDFNGNTGPFIQYTYARIRSVLNKVENREDRERPTIGFATIQPAAKELEVIKILYKFAPAVSEAGDRL